MSNQSLTVLSILTALTRKLWVQTPQLAAVGRFFTPRGNSYSSFLPNSFTFYSYNPPAVGRPSDCAQVRHFSAFSVECFLKTSSNNGSFTVHVMFEMDFSNSLIIHEAKTKENHKHDRFGNTIEHLLRLAKLSLSFSPEVRICLRSCIKHSY